MEKIKSVRIRNVDAGVDERLSASLDIKIDLFKDNNTYIIKANNKEYKYLISSNRYIDWDEDDFIDEVVSDLENENNVYYDVIQNPWQDEPPLVRKYGYDPYYLNNNSILFVYWIDENNNDKGGLLWSDDKGNEKDELNNIIKSDYRKIVIIKHNDNNHYVYTEKGFVILYEKVNISKLIEQNIHFYNGLTKDLDVINDIINKWKNEVPNYELNLCSPNHISCNIIEFISPIKEIRESENQHIPDNKEDNEIPKESETRKETILIIRDEEKKLKIKEDYKIELYIGDAKKQKETEIAYEKGIVEDKGFIFEDIENDDELDELYREADFGGNDENLDNIAEESNPETETAAVGIFDDSIDISGTPVEISKDFELDIIPGVFKNNAKQDLQCCIIDGSPVPVKIAYAYLTMRRDASKDGISLRINSAFRPAYEPGINITVNGKKVQASSQEYLYNGYISGKKGFNLAAKPGTSNHGNGIALDLNTGTRTKGRNTLITNNYMWLLKNSWKYGFVRTVRSEEWHFDYRPDVANKGPYALVSNNTSNLYYSDIGANKINIT